MEHQINRNLSANPATRPESGMATDFEKSNAFSLADEERKYSRQFFAMYQQRLAMLKPRVEQEAMKRWGHNTRQVDGQKIQHKDKILDIVSGELCWVLGTVFSDMKHKLNILQDVDKGVDDVMPSVPRLYVDEENGAVVMLEDESGRAILHNIELLNTTGLVTGCFVAVLGIEIQAGIFEIMEVANPVPAPQNALPSPEATPKFLALVSGLLFGAQTEVDLRLLLLQQWLAGEIGSDDDQKESSSVCRLIIAGDLVKELEPEANTDFQTTNNFGSKNTSHFLPESLKIFDQWLSEVVSTVPVTVMAGDSDPAEICLPQQPIHRSLFGANGQFIGNENLPIHVTTNPSWMQLANGLRVLGTSGQNITDILKYHLHNDQENDILDVMERTIKWQNIMPTAPDTLYCYPYEDKDPFTLDETPHLYFAGNQTAFASREIELQNCKVTAVSVPKFSETGEIVLVNTSTLETKTVSFSLE